MIGLLRYLFVVQHDYRDSAQAMRARVVLPLVDTVLKVKGQPKKK